MTGVALRTMSIEEEFHLVDLKTRRLTARAPELLAESSDGYDASLSPDATAFAHLVDDGGYLRPFNASCAVGVPARRAR
jgi:hypothetical protein